MRRRFCDRCGVQVPDDDVPHVDFVEHSDEEGSGDVTVDWDFCATCRSLFQRFMDGVKLQGEGE